MIKVLKSVVVGPLEPYTAGSPGPRQPRPSQAGTIHQTSCWPSWKPSDYADPAAVHKAATRASRRQVGIIRRSA